MRLVFAGTPAVAIPALDAIAASGHELVAVVTRPDAPAGRGRRLVRSAAGAWADERGIEVLTPQRPREPEFLSRLTELAPDCVPVVAYGALVPPTALAIPTHGWINLHFSLLPAWRGAAPVQHAVLHGDEVTGASVFQLEEGLDTGPVFGTVTDQVGQTDTAGDLLQRLASSGAQLLVAVLDGIAAGTARAVPQPGDGVSLAPKLTVDDVRVRWTDPAFAVDRRVRAGTPAPGAWTTFRDERVKLGPVRPVPDGPELKPGEALAERNRLLVGTATVPVALGEVRAAGKKAMSAADWARGARITTGEFFG
ncbi:MULTISPECIES: methionyl-tRNA formyltransferase [unclassified Solwaraspora]|uniref:methionyl-tRNA formyltransferase n=1 Tax=unclassified Solwaraspora TaxID=2627926 RepID=UPI00248B30DC|nr:MULTISPECIES: methionyl-tRNA formyltransferase [unclassified Solwaraspora]WBB99210.1 methionyl-tRNA formyltransferase [Solwaraspora sp. WMMA2059]WBC22237.1 methionyl-tRNA formyltransferase [Solwaraspora sp. WMMA2080]WJK35717.1 methionyl-tRNA formyltransferase [Solwaraspora sp. WMMA2065]